MVSASSTDAWRTNGVTSQIYGTWIGFGTIGVPVAPELLGSSIVNSAKYAVACRHHWIDCGLLGRPPRIS